MKNGRKWEVFYNVGDKSLGIRKVRYHGEIKGIDWSKYKTRNLYSVCCSRQELEKLRADIDVILKYENRSRASV